MEKSKEQVAYDLLVLALHGHASKGGKLLGVDTYDEFLEAYQKALKAVSLSRKAEWQEKAD